MPKAVYQDLPTAMRNLKVGDIVLVRTKTTLLSRVIRATTKSYWSHVAMVFDVPELGGGERDILIAEANTEIEIHRLNIYLDEPETYELGFKRMHNLTDDERERFRGFFLDAVDTPYDWRRLLTFFVDTFLAWSLGMRISYATARNIMNTRFFICTTFAQRAFYLAVHPEKRKDVLFRGGERDVDFLHQMEKITPGNVAQSANAFWLYNPHK